MGVADPNRLVAGGHSYGGFMTANLLAHSDLFRAGIARSGAYNRTLTPFGFQNEQRTFWEVPQIYSRMSPFNHAHQIKEPVLLIHGEADDNSGTFPIQSERFYVALKGHGATVRYVTLPHEAHGLRRARVGAAHGRGDAQLGERVDQAGGGVHTAAATVTMAAAVPQESVQPASRAAWRRWLERHHTRDRGVWLVYFKKSSGKQRFTYDDLVEEALCFGWIDGQARGLDDERSMLWLSPRKPKSVWSAPNKVRVARLMALDVMHPAGLAKVELAKKNGSWQALEATDRLEMPDDLAEALAATPDARAHFDAFPATAKKAVLEWVRQAKRPETRARRIAESARMAAANVRMDGTSPKSLAGPRLRSAEG